MQLCLQQLQAWKHSRLPSFTALSAHLCRGVTQTTASKVKPQPQLLPCLPHKKKQRNNDGTPVMVHGYSWNKSSSSWQVTANVKVPYSLCPVQANG